MTDTLSSLYKYIKRYTYNYSTSLKNISVTWIQAWFRAKCKNESLYSFYCCVNYLNLRVISNATMYIIFEFDTGLRTIVYLQCIDVEPQAICFRKKLVKDLNIIAHKTVLWDTRVRKKSLQSLSMLQNSYVTGSKRSF